MYRAAILSGVIESGVNFIAPSKCQHASSLECEIFARDLAETAAVGGVSIFGPMRQVKVTWVRDPDDMSPIQIKRGENLRILTDIERLDNEGLERLTRHIENSDPDLIVLQGWTRKARLLKGQEYEDTAVRGLEGLSAKYGTAFLISFVGKRHAELVAKYATGANVRIAYCRDGNALKLTANYKGEPVKRIVAAESATRQTPLFCLLKTMHNGSL